jgi:hypothetical protein
MVQQELNGAQIPGPSVDQRGFRATEGVRTEQPRIQANTGDPTRHQARVLSGRDAAARLGSAFKQILADVLLLRLKVVSTASRVSSMRLVCYRPNRLFRYPVR